MSNELNETVRLAELLYEVNQKLGVVTDFLLKQQRQIDLTDCKSFEVMFGLVVKQAESQEAFHEKSREEPGTGAVDESKVRAAESEVGQKDVVATLHSH